MATTQLQIANEVTAKRTAAVNNNLPIQDSNKPTLKTKIDSLVDGVIGSTDDEKRVDLPRLLSDRKIFTMIVARLAETATPMDVKEIHGATVRPLLKEVVTEKLAALPPVVEE